MGSNLDASPRYLRAVDKTFPELRDLFDAGEDIAALTAHPGWAHVVRLLDAQIAQIDADLDEQLLSESEYAFRHGRRSGLRGAYQVVAAIRQRSESRLEEQRSRHEDGAESLSGGSR